MIDFRPSGEVVVDFDDGTPPYILGRPKFKQWRTFKDEILQATQAARDELERLAAATAAANIARANATGKAKEEADESAEQAAQALKGFADRPFYETSSEIVRHMFAELGDRPLPDDQGEWPVYLVADVTVPGQILNHWQTAPLVSGADAEPTP